MSLLSLSRAISNRFPLSHVYFEPATPPPPLGAGGDDTLSLAAMTSTPSDPLADVRKLTCDQSIM